MIKQVGRYEVLRKLGRGGMATVYLARQTELDRLVALKELHAFHTDDDALARRFLRESRLAGSLAHPNIVTVYDYLEVDGMPYIAMEYIEAGSLRPFVARLSVAERLGVLEGMLAGLMHAEQHGVVHRDLKPENVLVTAAGSVKIADFGVAKATRSVSTAALTGTGMTVGTPGYMAPEQAMAQAVGPWTDLYALGCMAYELFVGALPFSDSESPMAVLLRHVNEPMPPAITANPNVDPAISNWIAALTTRDPGRRTQSAAAAWESLEDIAISLLGPRWHRDARITLVAPPPVAGPARPVAPPAPDAAPARDAAPSPSAPAPPVSAPPDAAPPASAPPDAAPPASASPAPDAAPPASVSPVPDAAPPASVSPVPDAAPPASPAPDTAPSAATFETFIPRTPPQPPAGPETEIEPEPSPSPSPPAPDPRPAGPAPARASGPRQARDDHDAVSPEDFLPGRSHYRGRPADQARTLPPRKLSTNPAPRPAPSPPSAPRVPPIAIAAVVIVILAIVLALALT